ncbi:hypothetical protein [Streptomyces sp. NPDC007172]|uniref:hypothetical protein n=1 Tax=Streptomyces sp. NPDC007172 TaxID=3364776 RepID=UPI0036A99120
MKPARHGGLGRLDLVTGLKNDSRSIDVPMGDSGRGRPHGADRLLKYTEAQTDVHQRPQDFTPPGGVEREQWARILTPAFKTLRALGIR